MRNCISWKEKEISMCFEFKYTEIDCVGICSMKDIDEVVWLLIDNEVGYKIYFLFTFSIFNDPSFCEGKVNNETFCNFIWYFMSVEAVEEFSSEDSKVKKIDNWRAKEVFDSLGV